MATSWRNKKNYPLGVGTLNTAIDDNDLSIVLDAGQGASFPSASFTISIDEEIILIDSRSTDTLTVNASGRGYDDSTASAHAAGVAIANYQIKKDFTDLETAINGIENGTTTLAKVVTSGGAANTHTIDDSATNTVVSVLELYKTSSGTPASGIGAKILLGGEDSAGNAESAIELHGYLTTVTNTSEQGAFLLRIKNAGSFIDALAITVASNTATIGSNQTTVNLWNTTATTVNAFGAGTTVNIGAASGVVNVPGNFNAWKHGVFGGAGAVSTQHVLVSHESSTLTSTTFIGAYLRVVPNAGATSSCSFIGARSEIPYNTAQSYTATDSSCYLGIFNVAQAATISRGHGVYAQITRTAAGTVTDYRGFLSTVSGSTTTVTTAYGVYLDKIGAGTTEYGLYVAGLNTAGTNYAIYTNAGAVRFGDSVTMLGAANVLGNVSTDLFTFTGRCILRSVTDAGPMTATGGTQREIVYNTSDSKFYGCTVTHASAATWVALN